MSPTHLWAAVLAEVLARHGVRHVVVSPGSRSTPLALAVAAHPALQAEVVVDERSAGFYALGLALATRAPVALVCTSGTAAANYHPAVVEAGLAGVPLVVLTADRPPALRGLGAPQTIDQVHLYGHAVRAYQELPLPAEKGLQGMAAQAALAIATACSAPVGPIHLNVPYDEPLAPAPGEVEAGRARAAELAGPRVWPCHAASSPAALAAAGALLAGARRPLVVAGPGLAAADGEALLSLAEALQAPLVADIGADMRGRGSVLCMAELFLRQPGWEDAPDLVIRAGGAPTGKAVPTYLARHAAPTIALQPDTLGRDGATAATHVLVGDIAESARRLASVAGSVPERRSWQACWAAADAATADLLADLPLEMAALVSAAASLPPGGRLCLSNSLPIRHADMAWRGSDAHVHVFRGANGIDGVTSAAIGIARATGAPTLLVTGDLAALHDLGGLAAARHLTTPFVLLVLNNDGGGIFSRLPIAKATDAFEELFGTPQSLDFGPAARMFGLGYAKCSRADEVGAAVGAMLATGGAGLVELVTTRATTSAELDAFLARVVAGGRTLEAVT